MLTLKNKLRENKEENLTAEIINYTTKNLINTEKLAFIKNHKVIKMKIIINNEKSNR